MHPLLSVVCPYVQNLEQVIFKGPQSRPRNLQAYYDECSQGVVKMDQTNSKVSPWTIMSSAMHCYVTWPACTCNRALSNGGISTPVIFLLRVSRLFDHGVVFLMSLQIVGPITIPCSYEGTNISFSDSTCKYSDAEGWVGYAEQQAAVSHE